MNTHVQSKPACNAWGIPAYKACMMPSQTRFDVGAGLRSSRLSHIRPAERGYSSYGLRASLQATQPVVGIIRKNEAKDTRQAYQAPMQGGRMPALPVSRSTPASHPHKTSWQERESLHSLLRLARAVLRTASSANTRLSHRMWGDERGRNSVHWRWF